MDIRGALGVCVACLCFTLAVEAQTSAPHQPEDQTSQTVMDLVDRAARFLSGRKLDTVSIDFTHNPSWREPNTKLFLIDDRNRIWCIRDEYTLIWKVLKQKATLQGGDIPFAMRRLGTKGGWISFLWNEEFVRVYVKNVRRANRLFTVGAFLFAEGPSQQVKELVFTARNLLKRAGLATAVEQINSPTGQFLKGSYSVALYDSEGVCLANSYNLACVGSRAQDRLDDEGQGAFGKYLRVTESASYGWVKSMYVGHLERMFVARFRDPKGPPHKFYIITSGYYPEVNDAFVVSMANKAVEIIKREGAQKAFDMFSPVTGSNPYYMARLFVVVYDEKGVIRAHSRFPSVVGMNAYFRKDQAGYFITQNILNTVLSKGEGWIFNYITNAAELIYGQRIDLPEGTFVATIQGYTPLDKEHISASIVEWLCSRLSVEPPLRMFKALNQGAAVWNQGFKGTGQANVYSDLFTEIYDEQGFCVTAGSQVHKMWKKMDSGFSHSLATLIKSRKLEGWFKDRDGALTRKYYVKRCLNEPSQSYSIFVGYVWP